MSEPDVLEQLAQAKRDLSDVIAALQLLGLRRCGQCRQFFDISKPGSLFGSNTFVCYGCIAAWWPSVCKDLDVTRREKLETTLALWLRTYHGARMVKEEHGKMPEIASNEFRIVVHCHECGGSGTLLGKERCRFCDGFGTVWVVATAPTTSK